MAVLVNKWVWVAVALGLISLLAWYVYQPKTAIDIEITGGFAYITPQPASADNRVEVAYLNSWTYKEDIDAASAGEEVICDVHQLGTILHLTTGDIVSYAPSTFSLPPDRNFRVNGAVITFPAIDADDQKLAINRQAPWPPSPAQPANSGSDPEWEDLKWVPSLSEYFAAQTPPHTLDPNWRSIVNGRMVLRGGDLRAAYPSNSRFRDARLDFKRGGSSKHVVAATDRTIYSIQIPTRSLPNGNLEILFNPAAERGLTRLEIKPIAGVISLKLIGEHDMSMQQIPADGAELKDFCAFHQLLQPPVRANEFLRPHYKAAASGPGSGGSPSPGWFCPGDWF